ncbi:MAG TPA: SRPBCC family protein [Longimicrobiales bacterium]|nr:SRPBCC family protein [Longimicrobiales bacterium]
MITVDERVIAADPDLAFRVAADVERWPEILPHYRYVRFLERDGFGQGVVEMAAWRNFAGPLRYPTWWVSEMRCDADARRVYYRHIRGITSGMDVVWELNARAGGTHARIVHEWGGPSWPLIGALAANAVIGPVFIHHIASRTLAGVGAEAERR